VPGYTKLNDPKVSYPRLRSINADAFHSKGATVGPTITNCIFMYHGDDCIDINTGGVVSSLDMGGSGFVIKNNKMGYTRARGILIKSSDGVISGNEVINCELSGIILAPELFWMEAGFSRNVLIENNTIKDCMFANSSYGIEQAAYVSVIAINANHQIVPVGGFRNITIKNNILENSPVPAMIITSVDSAQVTGNSITISKDIIRTHGKNFGVDNKQVIWTKNTSNLILKDNIINN
jgi:hypothetical protein